MTDNAIIIISSLRVLLSTASSQEDPSQLGTAIQRCERAWPQARPTWPSSIPSHQLSSWSRS